MNYALNLFKKIFRSKHSSSEKAEPKKPETSEYNDTPSSSADTVIWVG
jgi:hypothetical protein